jgi:LacI family transcriptional regulator
MPDISDDLSEAFPGGKSPTMRDVAERAGVSLASVSRVLRNDSAVRPHIRQAVEDAMKALNYESKPAAHNGRPPHLERIGLLIPDITNPYFPFLIKGITNIAMVQGAEVILYNSSSQAETEQAHLERLAGGGVDGIIYIPLAQRASPTAQKLVDARFPLVFLDRELGLDNTCSVTSNNEEGAYQAITYLLSLGHRDVVFLSGPARMSTSVARLAGYRKGLAEFGVAEAQERIAVSDTTLEGGYRETVRLIESKVPFTAIFASNDLMAFGVWKALEENGLRVPDDVSIIGYDDIPFAEYISMTTIAQPSYELGRNALMLLMDLIKGLRQPPQKILLRDSLIIRRSCRRI